MDILTTQLENVMRIAAMLVLGTASVGYRHYHPQTFDELLDRITSMLPSTVSHWALAGLGFVIASEAEGAFTTNTFLSFGTVTLILALLIVGTWLINDVFDKETDKHANADRATVRGTVSDRLLWITGGSCLALAGVLASTVGVLAVAATSAFVLVNIVYSVPPLRLKSHAITNMICNGMLGGLGFLLGASAAVAYPSAFILTLFVAVTAAVSINIPYWDLKDGDHDAKSGSDTIVVRVGAENTRRGLMILLPATYLVFAALLSLLEWTFVFVIIGVLAVFVLHNRRDDYKQLAYELDIVNGTNHVTLAILYVLF